MNKINDMINSLASGEKEAASAAFQSLMRDRVKTAVDAKAIEVAGKIFNKTPQADN
jgi:hypothetical protein